MISFMSKNIEGSAKYWRFESANDLIDEWNGECDLPSNDDPVWAIIIGNTMYQKRVMFKDLIALLMAND